MPKVPILMPQLGESIAEATIIRLNIALGDLVVRDQDIIEVETNKAVMEVTSLCSGKVVEIVAEEDKSYPVGSVLAVLEVSEKELEATGEQSMEMRLTQDDQDVAEDTKDDQHIPLMEADTIAKDELDVSCETENQVENNEDNLHFKVEGDAYRETKAIHPSIQGLPVPAGKGGAHYISPRLRARMAELGLHAADISAIHGSGQGGRVTVEDLEKFLADIDTWPRTKASPMRLAVADAMRRSWSRPLATVACPLVMEHMLAHRREQQTRPGITLYVLRALAIALAENPATAGYLIGESVVHPRSFDIGVAVQVNDGVVVPIIRNADSKKLSDLVEEYDEMVKLARERQLPESSTRHGIATVTNIGTFGLTWGTPIPLPNETLILGLGAGVKRPVWSEETQTFIPVVEAELDLTFDHRVVDGGGAGMLLNRIVELLQSPHLL